MGKKTILSGQEQFDGFSVSLYEGTFSGGFDIDEDMGQELAYDDVVTFVVTGRIGGVKIAETKTGDIKRVNSFQVTSSVALDPKMASVVLNAIAGQQPATGQQTIQGAIGDDDDDEPLDAGDQVLAGALSGPAVKVTDPDLAKFLEGQ